MVWVKQPRPNLPRSPTLIVTVLWSPHIIRANARTWYSRWSFVIRKLEDMRGEYPESVYSFWLLADVIPRKNI